MKRLLILSVLAAAGLSQSSSSFQDRAVAAPRGAPEVGAPVPSTSDKARIASQPKGAPKATGPLNLVILTLDTTRADRLGCYGSRTVKTPNLDRLAARGVLFENAVSVTPLTLPAHCSLFTGLLPGAHGVRDNGGFRLRPERTTLAEVLTASGYRTGGFVAAYVLDRRWGIAQGFDRYFDDFEDARDRSISMEDIQRRGDAVLREALPWIARAAAGKAPSDAASRSEKARGLKWDSNRAVPTPFFAWIHLYDPHFPYDPPEPFASRYTGRPYDGEIAWTDSLVGQVLGELNRLGLSSRTIVAVLADHGESLGEHGETGHGFFLYEPTTRIPLILAGPHPLLAPRRVSTVVREVDVAPTLLDLLGIGASSIGARGSATHDSANSIQGRSLVPLLERRSNDETEAYSESFYSRLHFGWSELRAVRTRRYHFIEAPRPELYDLEDDPLEKDNRAAKDPAVVSSLRASLGRIERETGIPAKAPSASASADDEEARQKLEALGYVGASAPPSSRSWKVLPDPKDRIRVYQLMIRAQAEVSSGASDRAVATIREALALDPEVTDAWFMLARAQAAKREWGPAAENYRKALERRPEHVQAIIGLSQALVETGKLEDAVRESRRFLQRTPDASVVHHDLGRLLLKASRLDEAEKEFTEALRLAPDLAKSAFDLGAISERRHDFPEAEQWFRKAIAIDPKLAEAHASLARRRFAAGDLHEAASEMRAAASLDPGSEVYRKALEDLEKRRK